MRWFRHPLVLASFAALVGIVIALTFERYNEPTVDTTDESAVSQVPVDTLDVDQRSADDAQTPSISPFLPTEVKTVVDSKVAGSISDALSTIRSQNITRANAQARRFPGLNTTWVRIDANVRVQVYVHMTAVGDMEIAELKALELEIEIINEELAVVQGWLPYDQLEQVSELSYVRRIDPPRYPKSRAGSVVTEGDSILGADLVRQLGFDGTGVKVGIISDGANDRATAQALGDLPQNITMYGSCTPRVSDDFVCDAGRTCNEGTAMMEIVHDLAPGAELAMGAVGTSLEFIQRVNDLVGDFGADIVIDDLGFFGEPYFADGPIAQAVASVANQVVYISSAGNSAAGHYEDDFLPWIIDDDVDVHNFGAQAGVGGDLTLDLVINPGRFLLTVLQWNDPFGASSNDYDLFLFNEAIDDLLCPLCEGITPQTGSQDPIEFFCYFNNGSDPVRGQLVVSRLDNGADRRLEMFFLGVFPEEYDSPEGSIFGHSGLPGVLGVGAIDANDPGNDTIEFFSSHGPSRIDFPSIQIREAPKVTAIDGVSVTGTGGFPSTFFGTSAAAPPGQARYAYRISSVDCVCIAINRHRSWHTRYRQNVWSRASRCSCCRNAIRHGQRWGSRCDRQLSGDSKS